MKRLRLHAQAQQPAASEAIWQDVAKLLNYHRPSDCDPKSFGDAMEREKAATLKHAGLALPDPQALRHEFRRRKRQEEEKVQHLQGVIEQRQPGDRLNVIKTRDHLLELQEPFFKELVESARRPIDQASERKLRAVRDLALIRMRAILINESKYASVVRHVNRRGIPRRKDGIRIPFSAWLALAPRAQKVQAAALSDDYEKFSPVRYPSLGDLIFVYARDLFWRSLCDPLLADKLSFHDSFFAVGTDRRKHWEERKGQERKLLEMVLSAFLRHASRSTPLAFGFCWYCGRFFVYTRRGGPPARTCPDRRACSMGLSRFRRGLLSKQATSRQ